MTEETSKFNVSRRSFLKAAAVAGGVVAAGSCLDSYRSLAVADAAATGGEQVYTTYCNACMGCPLEAVVRDGQVVLTRAKEIPEGPNGTDLKRMCARGASIPTMLVQPKRIQYPVRRVEGTERGAGQWERISWDDAISEICEKIKGYQAEFGPGSVCAFTYGTTEPRNMWGLTRLENVAQFSHQNRTTDFALSESLMYTSGGYFYQSGNDKDLIRNSKAFVIWGHNPMVSWPNTWHFIADAIENNGCKLVVVDPNKNTIAQKADLFVPVRPATDGALALCMISYIEENGLANDTFMQKKSCAPFLVKATDGKFLRKSDLEEGIDPTDPMADDYAVWDEATGSLGYATTAQNPSLRKEAFEVNGIPVNTSYNLLISMASEYDLARTAEITDLPEETILEFVDIITKNAPCDIFQGYGVDHYGRGLNNLSAISALRIQLGMVPDPRTPWGMDSSGFTAAEAEHPTTVGTIGTFMFHDLLDTGKYQFPSATMETPNGAVEIPGALVEQPLKMLISFGANIVNSCPDRLSTIEAYKKFDFLVTANVEWCDTADISDIVLPAAMIQESIAPMAFDGCLVYGEKCIDPHFEAKPDYEIAQLIAQGIGLGEWFQEDMETAMDHVMEAAALQMAGITPAMIKEAGAINMGFMPLPAYMTSTGRVQFYLESVGPFEYYGQAMNPATTALPYWEPPIEAWTVSAGGYAANPLAEKYPLQLIAGTRRFRVHSYYGQNPLLREMEINEPCVRINPVDAETRGIAEGDYVRLYNDRGDCVAKAVFHAGMRPGVLDIDRGWQGSQYKQGCSQNLTHKEIVEWSCPNYSYHDCLVQMEKWNG